MSKQAVFRRPQCDSRQGPTRLKELVPLITRCGSEDTGKIKTTWDGSTDICLALERTQSKPVRSTVSWSLHSVITGT